MFVLCRWCMEKFIRNVYRDAQVTREILQAQVDVQSSALRQIGEELHNHVGQLLAVAHIKLDMLEETQQTGENLCYITEANEMVSYSIKDLRNIGKRIGGDFVKDFKLADNIASELIQIRKASGLATELTISGEKYALGYEKEIVLFCISQEILNNIKQHSKATNIFVQLRYKSDQFVMHLSGNGIGFEPKLNASATGDEYSGLARIERKTEIIGGQFVLRSVPDKGTTIEIFLPLDNP